MEAKPNETKIERHLFLRQYSDGRVELATMYGTSTFAEADSALRPVAEILGVELPAADHAAREKVMNTQRELYEKATAEAARLKEQLANANKALTAEIGLANAALKREGDAKRELAEVKASTEYMAVHGPDGPWARLNKMLGRHAPLEAVAEAVRGVGYWWHAQPNASGLYSLADEMVRDRAPATAKAIRTLADCLEALDAPAKGEKCAACPMCNQGRVARPNGLGGWIWSTCPNCHGTGVKPAEKPDFAALDAEIVAAARAKHVAPSGSETWWAALDVETCALAAREAAEKGAQPK